MFLKIVHKEDDWEKRLECKTYEYQTDPENNKQAIFTLDIDRSYVFSKVLCIIWIESNTGETVDKFNWKERGDKAIRI